MRMSDLVAQYILNMLEQQDGSAEIQRNELAGSLGCVPSQINYVITSRFTPEQGYIVESRRGGGGYIRISRVKMDKGTALMHIINSVGATLDKATAEDTVKWYRTIHEVFERHQIARSAWSYREMNFGLSDARLDGVREELVRYL